MREIDILAELVSFHQMLTILALRCDNVGPVFTSPGISYEEFFEVQKKLEYRFLDLPEDLQNRIKEVRLEKYGIK